jgi:Zn-dependent protease with chaperone function
MPQRYSRRAMIQGFYPASPKSARTDLAAASSGYVARALLVLSGLALFVALYIGLGVAIVWFLAALWSTAPDGRAGAYVVIGGTVAMVALLAFLVKGLFFRESADRGALLEIRREEQPRLFAFIDRLVEETGAPRPRRVYVTANVNAAVFYEPSILSLVLPTPKSLVIGLGLVNYLTLSELKAVLGHELGHFSQRTMKIGAYVYVAQRVVGNLVYGRDGFDDALERAKRSDYRVALIAYLVDGLVWILRGILRAALGVVALGHRALGREMEFAADRMAVSVAGGDAIARGLYKAELADTCFAAAVARLVHAADQDLVTDDFFFHQSRAIDEVRARAKRPRWGESDDRQDGFLFAEDATSRPSMWATHPPSAERERAARALGVEAEHDERSAWVLFENAAALRAKATLSVIRRHIPHAKAFPKPAAEVEEILDRERRETEIVERAGAIYDGRPLAQLDLDAIFGRAPRSRPELEQAHAALGLEAKSFEAELGAAQADLVMLARAKAGQMREGALVIGGFHRELTDAPALFEQGVRTLEEIDRRLEKLDATIAEVHAEMAIAVSDRAVKRLRRAYSDVLRYGRWLKSLHAAREAAAPFLARVSGGEQLGAGDAHALLARVEDVRAKTEMTVIAARDRRAPKFLGLAARTTLGAFLMPRPVARPRDANEHPGHWMGQVLSDAAEVTDKLARIHRRALATLLRHHDETHAAWSTGALVADDGADEEEEPVVAEGSPAAT